MKKTRLWARTLLLITALAAVCFYLSKLEKLQFSDGRPQRAGRIDDSEVQEEQRRIEEAAAGLEERSAVEAQGEIFRDNGRLNILLIGTDEHTPEFSADARGDCCMLLSLGKRDGSIRLASFERGMGVPLPEGEHRGEYDWLTHMFAYGGAELMMREIRECFRVDVERYVRVNLSAFERGIDTIGGLELELTQAEAEYLNKYTRRSLYAPGVNRLDGLGALTYVRCRSIDSDWQRIERQRRVLQAALDETKGLDAKELNRLLDSVLPLVQTNLTRLEITGLLLLAPSYQGRTAGQLTVPVEGSYGVMTGMGGRSMFAADFDENARALRRFLYE